MSKFYHTDQSLAIQRGQWGPGWCESKYPIESQSNMLMDVGMGGEMVPMMPQFELPELEDALFEIEAEFSQCEDLTENTRYTNC